MTPGPRRPLDAAADALGQLAAADPHADDFRAPQGRHGGEEILGRLLVGQPADRADYGGVGRQAEGEAGALARLRLPGAHARPRPVRPVHRDADGADPLGRDQLSPDGFGGDRVAHAQAHVGDPAQPPLDRYVGPAPGCRLELVEREAVEGVHDPRNPGPVRGQPADGSGLRAVGVHHVELPLPEDLLEPSERRQIAARGDHLAQRGVDEDLEAGGRGLVEQRSRRCRS